MAAASLVLVVLVAFAASASASANCVSCTTGDEVNFDDGTVAAGATLTTQYTHGVIMRPNRKGQWGNDLRKHIPYSKGFWIKDAGATTWTPSPVGYTTTTTHLK